MAQATIERTPPAPAVAEREVVVISGARTDVERDLVERWAHNTYNGTAELVSPRSSALSRRLAADDDPLIVPVRVAWLPRERRGDRRVRLSDVLALTNPRRPPARLQSRIARREPDRCPVLAGEPATASDLRERWRRDAGGAGGPDGLAAWVSRQAVLALERAERAVVGDRYKVPRLVAEQITDSARFRQEVSDLARRLEEPEAEVQTRAGAALTEMVAVQSRLAIDLFAAVMSPLHARAWDVRADIESLEALRELNRRHALVFLPSHRSYADPLVLAQVLDEHDFPRNHLMGGNNMAFWPIGPLGRRAGVVFIRRSFRDDEVYKLSLREYIGYLVDKRFNLEWYIEGGRSRTGKLRPPRYGLLRYLIAALESGRAEDACLVPVSITYDQLSEVGAMAAEQEGASKKSEGLGWLAGYVRAQRRRTGAVHLRFGEPFSLRERLAEGGPRAMEKVAFEVCDRINRATPVVATSLVTLALLGVRDRALTLPEVRSVLEPLLDYVQRRQLPVGEGIEGLRGPGLRRTLDALAREGVVTAYTDGTEPVYAIEPGRHHTAAFYRNSASHWLVNRAIVELAIIAGSATLQDAWERALQLRDVLKHEFFFADKREFRAQLVSELELLDPAWESTDPRKLLEGSGLLLAHRVLRPFVDAYLVVCERLAARDPRRSADGDDFLTECMKVGRQMLLQGRVHSPESVSRELFAGALELARHRDVLDPGREELGQQRRELAEEIAGVAALIDALAELDTARNELAAA